MLCGKPTCRCYEISLTNLQAALSARGTRKKKEKIGELGLLKTLKQFRKSCICIYSPCESDFWQLQSDRYTACFKSIKTKRGVCVWEPFDVVCFCHLVAIWWYFRLMGERSCPLGNLKIKFFCLKVGRWVKIVSTSLRCFRNEARIFINIITREILIYDLKC